MRTREFDIPQELIGPFFNKADKAELEVELIEVTEDHELTVEVSYEDAQRDDVMNLIEMIDDFNEENEEEEDDDESDDEEEEE